MNQSLNSPSAATPATGRTQLSNLTYGMCSALMPYALATLLLMAFG